MGTTIDSLRSTGGGKRVRVHDSQIAVKLSKEAKALIKQVADSREVSESTVVRDAIADYLERRGYRS